MEVPFVKKNRSEEGGAAAEGERKAAADKKKRRLSNGLSLLTPMKAPQSDAAPSAADKENLKSNEIRAKWIGVDRSGVDTRFIPD